MKPTIWKLKIVAVLATLIYLGFAFPIGAADFFPLDLWEEMAGWQQNKAVVRGADIEAYSEPMRIDWDKAATVHTTFPFDVAEELNARGNGNGYDSRENDARIGHIHGNKTNPYWLPVEFRTDIAVGLTMVAKRN